MVRRAPALAALAVGLAVILLNLPFWASPSLREQGDLAANALQVERAREFKELLGPYSWHGFHHPGPVSFYGQALSEPLFFLLPAPLAKHSAFQLAIGLLLVLWTVRLLRRSGLPPPLAVAAVFLLLAPLVFLAGGSPIMLASVWGPVVVVFPMLLFVVASARILAGDPEALPAAALGATIAWHNHLPTVPLLAMATAALALLSGRAWIRARRGPRARASLVAALVITALGWLPPLYEELSHSPGNLTLIARYLWSTPPGLHRWSEVIANLGPAFTDPWTLLFNGAAPIRSPWPALALVAALAVVSAVQFRRSALPWRFVIAQTWAAILVTVLAARHISGELQTYLFYYLYGVTGLLGVFVAKEIWDRWLARPLQYYRPAGALITLVGLALFVALIAGHRLPPPAAPDVYAGLTADLDVTAGSTVALERSGGPRDADLWQKVPTLALALRRAGVRVTVSAPDVLLCTGEMRPDPGADPPLTLLITRHPPQGPGIVYRPVGDWGVVISGLHSGGS